jgi:hypothetical protein
MSNLRNNGFNESVPIGPEEILRGNGGFGEQDVLIDNGGFSSFHHFEEKDEGGNQAKLIGGALVVALLLGAAGIYAYTGSGSNRVQKAPPSSTASNMLAPSPIQTTPMTAPAAAPQDAVSGTPAKSPYDAAPAATGETASGTPDATSGQPAQSAGVHIAKGKDDGAQNRPEAEQTVRPNRGNLAADRATRDGSVAVPLPIAPSSSMTGTDALSAPADNSASPPDQNAARTSLPTPPSPPDSSMAGNGQAAGSPAQDLPASVTPEQQPATVPAQPVQAPAKLQ